MKHLNHEIEILLSRGYSDEAAAAIRALTSMADENVGFSQKADDTARRYAMEESISMSEALEETEALSREYDLNVYSLNLLLLINSLPYLHEKYISRGVPDEIFFDTMDDIRCKVHECIACRAITGIFVPGWYDGFYKMTRFAYGRFQYEVCTHGGEDFTLSCGKVLRNGGTYINMHIPSNGVPLSDEVRLASYRSAYPHFSQLFDDGLVIFGCSSWLLFPAHREFLPSHLNILRFMDDFETVSGYEKDEFGDKWRVFGKYADLPANELPRDTALRRAYADWLSSGRRTGAGFGVFAFDGEKIIR